MQQLGVASEIYHKNSGTLCTMSKSEISKYAHQKYHCDIVGYYFPNLPPPMTKEEENQIVSVDALENDLEEGKKKLAAEQKQQPPSQS